MILPKSSLSYLYNLDFNRSVYSSTIKEIVQQRDYASLVEVIKFMESTDLEPRHRMQTVHELTNALLPSVHEEHYGPDSSDRAPVKALAWSKAAEDFYGRMLAVAKKSPELFLSPVCCILDAALKFQVDALIVPALALQKKQKVEKAGMMLVGAWANDASMRYVDALEAKGKLTADVRLQLIEGHLSRRTHKNFGRGFNPQFLARCFTPELERRMANDDGEISYVLDCALQRGCVPFLEAYPNLARQQKPAMDYRSGRGATLLMTLNKHLVDGRVRFDEWQGALQALTSPPIGLDVNEAIDGASALLVLARSDPDPASKAPELSEDQLRLAIVTMLEAGADPHRKIPPCPKDPGDADASVIERLAPIFPERVQIMRTWVVKEQIKRVAHGAGTAPSA